MDTAQWPQEIVVKPMEDIISNTCSSSVTAATACSNIISNNNNNTNTNNNTNDINTKTPSTSLERKVRPQKDHALNCPRCNSTNTKFCYYNNYSLTQPRYFCKSCRRYWTAGGSLRNIPVGGGSRKNKRSSSSSSYSSSKRLSSHDLVAATTAQSNLNQNPNHKIHQDLNLGFPSTQEFRSLSEFMQLPTMETTPSKSSMPNSGDPANNGTNGANQQHPHHHLSALELLNGLTSSRGMTPFMAMPVSDPNSGVYSSAYPMSLQDFKPSLNFSLEGLGNGYHNMQGVQQQAETTNNNNNSSSRLLFPFEDLKQVSSTSGEHNNESSNNNNHDQQNREHNQGDSNPGFWGGMLGAEGSW